MPSATDIANWIVIFRADNGAPVDPMSLQKLLFYSNAFCLAQEGEPLFRDRFKAWRNGPVLPQIWHDYAANDGRLIVPTQHMGAQQLGNEHEKCVRGTVEFFSRLGPFTLSNSTHHEEPWLRARGNAPEGARSDEPIPEGHIREYYAGLISDGEDALSRHQVMDLVPEPRVGYYYRSGICVRRMTNHPLYQMDLAQGLLGPVREGYAAVPADLSVRPRRREFVSVNEL